MLIITETLPSFESYCDFLGYTPSESLFFDIETTGLSAASSMVFLIGAVYFDGEDWQLKQFLAENVGDEVCILKDFFTLAEKHCKLIHFNGTTFDLPYLAERAKVHSLTPPLARMDSLDLYQKLRPLKKTLNLPRMNQQTLEQFLKWPRKDQLTGKHMISLFKKYAASSEQLVADLLLLHNHDDLVGMTQILKLCSYQMLFEGKLKQIYGEIVSSDTPDSSPAFLQIQFQLEQPLPELLSLTAPAGNSDAFARYADTLADSSDAPTGHSDSASGCSDAHAGHSDSASGCSDAHAGRSDSASGCSDTPAAYSSTLDALTYSPKAQEYHLEIHENLGKLQIPCFCGELKYFFPDYRNYYYLPMEDQAIHKSIGAFVDAEHRENARPANCYTRKNSVFLFQPEVIFEPVFRRCHNSKELYFEYKDEILESKEQFILYVKKVLQYICR